MARIRRWKEELLLVCFALFASIVWARPRSHTAESGSSITGRSLVVTGSSGKRGWGIAFSATRPYVRAFSASLVPVQLPFTVGAFAASAAATAGAAGAAAATGSCYTCITSTAPYCITTIASCCNPCEPNGDGGCVTTGGGGGGGTGCYYFYKGAAGARPDFCTCTTGTC